MLTNRFANLMDPVSLVREVDDVMEALAGAPRRPRRAPLDAPRFGTSRPFPPLNVWDDGGVIVIEAELPGFRPADVDVTMERDVVTIRGQRGTDAPPDAAWLHRERGAGRFERSVRLTDPVDHDRITATFEHGVLSVRVPKAAHAQPRRIAVNAAPAARPAEAST